MQEVSSKGTRSGVGEKKREKKTGTARIQSEKRKNQSI